MGCINTLYKLGLQRDGASVEPVESKLHTVMIVATNTNGCFVEQDKQAYQLWSQTIFTRFKKYFSINYLKLFLCVCVKNCLIVLLV